VIPLNLKDQLFIQQISKTFLKSIYIYTRMEVTLCKSFRNSKDDENHPIIGKSNSSLVPANMSGVFTINIKLKDLDHPYIPLTTIICGDKNGGLTHYVCSITNESFDVYVENHTQNDRIVSIAYKIEYL